VVELAYTAVSKTAVLSGNCGFESHRPHLFLLGLSPSR
jgi:hypothetical protein